MSMESQSHIQGNSSIATYVELSPAELYVLLFPDSSTYVDIIKLSVKELLIKDGLEISKSSVKHHPLDPARSTYSFLERGKHFGLFHNNPLHHSVLNLFREVDKFPLHLLGKKMVIDKSLRKEIKNIKKYVIFPSLEEKGLVEKKGIRLFGASFRRTPKGKETATSYRDLFKRISNLIQEDPVPETDLNSLLRALGPHIIIANVIAESVWTPEEWGKLQNYLTHSDQNLTVLEELNSRSNRLDWDLLKLPEFSTPGFNSTLDTSFSFNLFAGGGGTGSGI